MIKYVVHFVIDEGHDFYLGNSRSNYPYSENCPWFAKGKSRKFVDLKDYVQSFGFVNEKAASKAKTYGQDVGEVVAVEVA